jgi:hypothetical protein
MEDGERRIFVIEKASRVRNALCVLSAGVECHGDIAHGTRMIHETFAGANREQLVLHLRYAEKTDNRVSPGVKILEASLVGGILVVIGQVTDPRVFQEIEELVVSHFSLKYITSSFRTFAHALFSSQIRTTDENLDAPRCEH